MRSWRAFLGLSAVCLVGGGAGLGLILLVRVALAGKFTGVSIYDVNAHAHLTLSGFFVAGLMGLTYRFAAGSWLGESVPASQDTAAASGRGRWTWWLLATGLALSTAGIAMRTHPAAIVLRPAGGLLELAAIGLFLRDVWPVVSSKIDAQARGFVLAGLAILPVQAVLSTAYDLALATVPDRNALLLRVSTWQAPLRDVQTHGLMLLTAIGAGLATLPAWRGLGPRRTAAGLWVLLAAVAMEAGLFVLYRMSLKHWMAGLLMVPWLMLPVGMTLATGWRRQQLDTQAPATPGTSGSSTVSDPGPDRDATTLRPTAASVQSVLPTLLGWMAVSLAMLLLMPLYLRYVGVPFSHAYYGASRHAMFVGVIGGGLMVAIQAALRGNSMAAPAVWFVLWNLGCLLHVTAEGLSDLLPWLVGMAWVGGVLELLAAVVWASGLLRLTRTGTGVEP